jgi:hypothetical protein
MISTFVAPIQFHQIHELRKHNDSQQWGPEEIPLGNGNRPKIQNNPVKIILFSSKREMTSMGPDIRPHQGPSKVVPPIDETTLGHVEMKLEIPSSMFQSGLSSPLEEILKLISSESGAAISTSDPQTT